MHDCDTYFKAWPRFMTRTIYVNILGPAGPLMYPDQISHYSTFMYATPTFITEALRIVMLVQLLLATVTVN